MPTRQDGVENRDKVYLKMLVFDWREMGKPEEEKPLAAIKDENQQQTKSTYGVDGRWRPINFQRLPIIFLATF